MLLVHSFDDGYIFRIQLPYRSSRIRKTVSTFLDCVRTIDKMENGIFECIKDVFGCTAIRGIGNNK
jgi:hypothetical protein